VVDLSACFLLLHAELRVRLAPGIPCALFILRDMNSQKLGRNWRRENVLRCAERSNRTKNGARLDYPT
jgi:hypothetical protein